MAPAADHLLPQQLRQCAKCKKGEMETDKGIPVVLQVCGRCRSQLYCSTKCQHSDWRRHRKQCAQISSAEDFSEYDTGLASNGLLSGGTTVVTLEAIEPIHQDWTVTYRPLICLSVINAMGLADRPPTAAVFSQPPQIFFIKMSVVSGLTLKTKARKAFLVEHAELINLDEFRRASMNQSHPLHTKDSQKFLLGYNRYKSNMLQTPERRLTMVVQSVSFHNGTNAMTHTKNWYFEDNRTRDYSTQWRPDDWLSFFKETVADGKGWYREDVWF
ncbi:hypothetical protein LshimejAT787_1800870 [Lyophyllum shimeji]|uniref:MYND-type domain-containing protein n=1 Tax=Lyophyllum shimeji TaxID=47721 RepID=A0A9P3PZA5_LYOSH|nr:hypothetical protein LshimejAT787_1800870 [Lyophyllum shimeji]